MNLSQQSLREALWYLPDSGIFLWRLRPVSHFGSQGICDMWNSRWAGAFAGGVCPQGYLRIRLFDRTYPAHRLAFLYMEGAMPAEQVDHINHIRGDNRWHNLRHVSHIENCLNRAKSSRNTSGEPGVVLKAGHWCAFIYRRPKNIQLGVFATREEAIVARRNAIEQHGFHPNHGITLVSPYTKYGHPSPAARDKV